MMGRSRKILLCAVVAILGTLPLLAACGDPVLEQRKAALGQLVGQTEAELVRQMGAPARSFESNGHRFLAYVEHRSELNPWTAPWTQHGYRSGGFGGAEFPPEVLERACETTFEIADGRVQSFSLRGDACG
jgi:hypothetical protein